MTLPALFEIHPRPWKAQRGASLDGQTWRVVDAQGRHVECGMVESTARLLAAAPGLVEAHESALAALQIGRKATAARIINAALAALKEENRG